MSIYFLFIFQQFIASSAHLFAKDIVMSMHPVNVVFYRGAFSVLPYALWMWFNRAKSQPIVRSDLWRYFLLGIVNMPLNQLLFIWGLTYTTPANAALAYALSPAFVAVISAIFYNERLGSQSVTGIFIAIAGTFIVLFEKGFNTSSEFLAGNIIELCASLSWAIFTILGRSLSIKYGAIRTTCMAMFTGFIAFIPIVIFAPIPFIEPQELTSHQWFDLAYLGVIISGIGFGLWKYLLTKRSSVQVSVFNNLQPVITTILAIFIFGLKPSFIFIIGGIVTLAGVLITQRK